MENQRNKMCESSNYHCDKNKERDWMKLRLTPIQSIFSSFNTYLYPHNNQTTQEAKLTKLDHILFYDGDCPFCNRMVLWLIKRDKNEILRYAPLNSNLFKSMVPAEDYEMLLEMDTLIYIEKGEIFYYSTAALRALRATKSWWIITFKMSFVPRSIRDYFYRRIAANRKRIYSTCRPIPMSKRHLFLPS